MGLPPAAAYLLVVEDDLYSRDMLTRRLTRRGYEVRAEEDGAAAISAVEARQPDLIIMDLRMPVIDGWEATRRLKAHPGTQSIPILVLTANTSDDVRARAFEAGCDGFSLKPVAFDQLLNQVDGLLRKRGTQDKRA